MSDTKFTIPLLPWTCDESGLVNGTEPGGRVSFDIFDAESQPVTATRNRGEQEAEWLAIAHLIAAAPALLEALEAADRAVNNAIGSEQLSDQGIHGKAARLNDKVWEWRKMREAALKKARGEK